MRLTAERVGDAIRLQFGNYLISVFSAVPWSEIYFRQNHDELEVPRSILDRVRADVLKGQSNSALCL